MRLAPTIAIDFDGVIHSYTSGWTGIEDIPDPPVPGIREAIDDIRRAGYQVVIYSTRCVRQTGQSAIIKWLDKYGIVVDDIVKEKPPAIVYIDDRAICFDGKPDNLLNKIQTFTPWNKR